ncbi:E3 ubiquitin-protein ligase Mdm2-like [Uloborus diversus]|uniref:E3 ubiquitin-protein ligase Mdm2-like n=1 Tax=Uloborus diversus TaxID=327109 RepID=UPI002409E3D5|nr:E3 ubiquitin-protein ligase Mdm2-like [Uloborus diversus]
MSMTTAEAFAFSPKTLKSFFYVSEELHALIGTVKEIAAVTTLEEVLIGLKVYICKKRLFDPHNPFRISCQNDELASVFGVADFTFLELRNILEMHIKPIDKCDVNSFPEVMKAISDSTAKRTPDEPEETTRKRKCSESYSSVCTCNKHSPMVLYIPTSPLRCATSGSAESIQVINIVACVKDSTEEDVWSVGNESKFIVAEERTFDAEIDSDNGTQIGSENEGAEESALNAAVIRFTSRSDSDVEFWADHSSEEDSPIPRSDLWKCEDCQNLNKPLRRFCLRCWGERPNWLPENDKKLKEQKASLRRKRQRYLANVSRTDRDSAPSTQESLSSSQEIANTDAVRKNTLCIICCRKPANASIVHSRYAHQVACYKCAKKLKKQKQRCPVCRRTIDKVVYQVTAF